MYLWGVLIKSLYTLGDYPLDEVSTENSVSTRDPQVNGESSFSYSAHIFSYIRFHCSNQEVASEEPARNGIVYQTMDS